MNKNERKTTWNTTYNYKVFCYSVEPCAGCTHWRFNDFIYLLIKIYVGKSVYNNTCKD